MARARSGGGRVSARTEGVRNGGPRKAFLSCGASGWGGLERQALLLAETYRDRGLGMALLARPDTPFELEARARGFEVFSLLPEHGSGTPASVLALARLLRRERPRVLHLHEGRDLRTLAPALALSGVGAALYATRHMGLRHDRHDLWHRWLYARVRRFYAISHHVAAEARRVLPLESAQIVVRPPGIDLGRFDPERVDRTEVRTRLGWARDEIVVGMLGRITALKGHDDLLAAAERLLPSRPELRFVFVGSPGREEGERALERSLRERSRPLGARVSWHAATDRPEDYYAAFDVFVFPSHAEAFGLALVEAMAMRCPVVAAASAGVLDIVDDGRDGLLYTRGSVAELADRIAFLVDRPDRAEALARRAREKALETWGIDRIAGLYIEDFERDSS
jgi:glycosyltransferase involved in cell wall biosynthesis